MNITNERLSLDEIERMVQEAETYRAEEEEQRKRVAAKNELELCGYNIKQLIEGEKVKCLLLYLL